MSPAPETVVAEPVAAAAGVVDAAAPPSIFDRLGGEAAVEKAVDVFYERIVADPQLAPFFEGVDMRTQRRKQVSTNGRMLLDDELHACLLAPLNGGRPRRPSVAALTQPVESI